MDERHEVDGPGGAGQAGGRAAEAPRVDGWAPVRRLGQGSQAEVWLVEDDGGTRAAVKVARPGAASDALAAEAQAARVRHPHLLRVLGVVDTDRGVGVLSEHRPAGTLQDMVQRAGPLTPGQAVTLLVPVAQALACLHAQGVVHGDVSPANVLFGVDGSPALADLGVARIVGGHQGTGATPGFAAPEVLAALKGHAARPGGGPAVGAEADVYAWAALGWYALTGRAPGAHGHRAPLPVLVPEATPAFALLLDSALRADPHERPTAQDVAAAVYHAARPEPVPLEESAPAEVAHLLPTVLSAPGGVREGRRPRGTAAGTGRSRGRAVVLGAVLLLLLGGGGLAAAALTGGEPADVAAEDSAPGAGSPGEPSAPTGAPAPGERSVDPAAHEFASALEAIGRARTAALTDPQDQRPDAYAVPQGPAWEADRDLQRRLIEDGFSFSGLQVRLEAQGPARPMEDGGVRLDAVVRTTAHTVLDREGRTAAQRPALAEAVVLVLRLGDPSDATARAGQVWRVEALEPR